jgi:hypothetical protein
VKDGTDLARHVRQYLIFATLEDEGFENCPRALDPFTIQESAIGDIANCDFLTKDVSDLVHITIKESGVDEV